MREVSSIQGKVVDLLPDDGNAQFGSGCLQRRDSRLHRHGLGDDTWIERVVNRRGLIHIERDVGALRRFEAAFANGEVVFPRLNVRNNVETGVIGHRIAIQVRGAIVQDDGSIRDDPAAGVAHGTVDRSPGLPVSSARQQEGQNCKEQKEGSQRPIL